MLELLVYPCGCVDSTSEFRRPIAGKLDTSNTCDNSFSIRFEDSNSDNDGDEDSYNNDDGEDCSDDGDIESMNEESTGGIMFKADETNEIKVGLKIVQWLSLLGKKCNVVIGPV